MVYDLVLVTRASMLPKIIKKTAIQKQNLQLCTKKNFQELYLFVLKIVYVIDMYIANISSVLEIEYSIQVNTI